MKLSEVKEALQKLSELTFRLEDGTKVPAHFHVTEVGRVKRNFIDCGGTKREDEAVNFQLWTSYDFHHRLKADKLMRIIELAETSLQLPDAKVEVEYQTSTKGIYGLDFDGKSFVLTNSETDCLAKDNCGIPTEKIKTAIGKLTNESCCTPGGGCC